MAWLNYGKVSAENGFYPGVIENREGVRQIPGMGQTIQMAGAFFKTGHVHAFIALVGPDRELRFCFGNPAPSDLPRGDRIFTSKMGGATPLVLPEGTRLMVKSIGIVGPKKFVKRASLETLFADA